jgi:EEF1A lysine methyltransferase 4
LTADLYHAGYQDQVSIDFSSQAIETMKARHEDLHLDWREMDVRHMEFADATFDVAIDKVGPER